MTESRSLAAQFAAQSAAMTGVSDRFNRLKHARSDRSNCESANLQSVPLPPVPSARHSRRRISRVETRTRPHAPPKMRSSTQLDTADYCRCRLQIVRESRTKIVVMHLVRFFLHLNCHALSRRFRRCRSPTNPIRHSFPPFVSLLCSMPPMQPSTSQSSPNAFAGIALDATDRETLLKAKSKQRFTVTSNLKIRSFLADAELFLTLCSRPRDRWGYFVLA